MNAPDDFDAPPSRPRGQSAGDAMLRRRFARQLGAEAEAPPPRRPRAEEPPPAEPPFLGPAPRKRSAPPPAPRPGPRPEPPESAAAPEAFAAFEEEEALELRSPAPPPPPAAEAARRVRPAPAPPPPAAPSEEDLEHEFLSAFSEDPPAAAPGEDFLSEFAPEPEARRPEPRPQPQPRPEPESAPPIASVRRSLNDRAAEAHAAQRSGGRHGLPAISGEARDLADGRKRSREFALNFERLRKFGFITPSARRSRLSEEIRLIKRRLIRRMTLEETGKRPAHVRSRAPRGRQHVILFTSAKPSEGKSFVAVNLALSIILDEGLNVLLVDADAARPSLSKILGLKPNLKGLTDLLEEARHGQSDVSGRMLRTPDHPLTFIPAGEAVESATDLYGGDAMRNLMADLADRYSDRIILIDGPPLLASTEPVELARHAGQVVMVVDAERTTRKAVEAALDLLGPEANVNLVLNKATASGRLEQFGSYYEAYANDSAPRRS